MNIHDLTYSLTTIKGIGGKGAQLFSKTGIETVSDLVQAFPRTFSDRTSIVSLGQACRQDSATVKVTVTDHRMHGKKWRSFLKILITDGTSYGALVCFNRDFLKNKLTVGSSFYVTGRFSVKFGEIQCSSFEYESDDGDYVPRIIPVYRLTAGLTQNSVRKAVQLALARYRFDIESELPASLMKSRDLIEKSDALGSIHFPQSFEDFFKARRTFIYEEFFYQRLFLLKRAEQVERITKNRNSIRFAMKEQFIKGLPFAPAPYQLQAIAEIEKDLFSSHIFSRLLQGDVGSGKTVVAFATMVSVIEAGLQCAFMAPTEILASQHYTTLLKFYPELAEYTVLLTGSLPATERQEIVAGIADGKVMCVIGTHALFSRDIVYKRLGYVVVDEQQRFGVEQRLELQKKGDAVDLLLMTATPIPRSLAMTLYGDLKVTTMQGGITGRLPVKTWKVDDNPERLSNMHTWIRETVGSDGRVMFIYTHIEDSSLDSVKDLTSEFKKLREIYGSIGCEMLHSKIEPRKRDSILDSFRSGEIQVLAATTVVEVGLDVPDATIIVVENADHFGLSTLHQLRGRVGRNNRQGYMILVAEEERMTENGRKRLDILQKNSDGFVIAEEDLKLRGPGDFLGTRQSGLPRYRFGDIQQDLDLLKLAAADAEDLYRDDPDFAREENSMVMRGIKARLAHYNENI
jgi:ATP-dependent DNA helicase RecG